MFDDVNYTVMPDSKGGNFKIRVRIPERLQKLVGKPEIHRTTGVSKKQEANRIAPAIFANVLHELFSKQDEVLAVYARRIEWTPREVTEVARYGEFIAADGTKTPAAGQEVTYTEYFHPEFTDVCEEVQSRYGMDVAIKFADRLSGKLSLSDAVPQFESYLREHNKWTGTSQRRIQQIKVFVEWVSSKRSHVNLVDLHQSDAREFRRFMKYERKSSDNTVRNYISALSSLWKWAIEDYGLTKSDGSDYPNIWAGIIRSLDKKPEVQTRPFSPNELDLVLERLNRKGARTSDRDLFLLCVYLGCRIEEAASIQAHHVRIDGGGPDQVIIPGTKTDGSYDSLPLVHEVPIGILRARASGQDPDDYLFPNREINWYTDPKTGEIKRSKNVSKRVSRIIKDVLSGNPDTIRLNRDGKYLVKGHSARAVFTTCADQAVGVENVIKRLRRDVINETYAKSYGSISGSQQLIDGMTKLSDLIHGRCWEV